jgi:hypothetical protein
MHHTTRPLFPSRKQDSEIERKAQVREDKPRKIVLENSTAFIGWSKNKAKALVIWQLLNVGLGMFR